MRTTTRLAATILLVCLVAACGGGGEDPEDCVSKDFVGPLRPDQVYCTQG